MGKKDTSSGGWDTGDTGMTKKSRIFEIKLMET